MTGWHLSKDGKADRKRAVQTDVRRKCILRGEGMAVLRPGWERACRHGAARRLGRKGAWPRKVREKVSGGRGTYQGPMAFVKALALPGSET